IAVPDRARDFPARSGVRCFAPPQPDAFAFIVYRPPAALGHAVEHPAVPVDGDVAYDLQLFRKNEKKRSCRRETLAPDGALRLDAASRGPIRRHADDVTR